MQKIISQHYYVVVLFFALLASIFAVVQSLRTTPLVDYAYQIENAYRIYSGELPYRDFFLVLPPGTYVLIALSMIMTQGYSHLGHMILIILETFAAVVITGYILARLTKDRVLCLIVLSLTLGTGHVIYPWASYDLDTVLFILISLAVWLGVLDKKKNPVLPVLLGIVFSLPTYFKHNIGLVYSSSILFLYFIAFLRFRKREFVMEAFGIGLGMTVSYGLFFLWLASNGIVDAFMYQAFIFPGKMKQPMVAVMNITAAYREYGEIMLSHFAYLFLFFVLFLAERIRTYVVRIGSIAFILFLIYHTVFIPEDKFFYYPFLIAWCSLYVVLGISILFYFFRARSSSELLQGLFPIACIAACHATYLSHHMVNASYGIWSLFIIMLIPASLTIKKILPEIPIRLLTSSIVIYMVVLLVRYNVEFGFFGSIQIDGPRTIGTNGPLQGLATRGIWILDMERMIEYSEKNIPKTDRIAFFPGEDPFFAITKRKNPLSFVQFQMGTYPMFEHNIKQELLNANVEWIIVKQEQQLLPGFGFVDITDPLFNLASSYQMVTTLPRYSIWKRISVSQ